MKNIFILILLPFLVFAQKPYRGAEYRTIQAFTYGRFEVRMKSAQVSGMLSSFFTYHEKTSNSEWNEIDIEILGRYGDQVQFNTITPGQSNHIYSQTVPFNPHKDFHIYAIEWTPDYVSWYVDSLEIYRQTGNHISTLHRAQKLMMNIWPPNSQDWVGPLNPDQLPVYAYYDWVRVYQYTPGQNQDFTLLWQDDFDTFDQSRWQKATHTWDGNNSQFIKENAVLRDGYLILCLTKPTSVGYQGGTIKDEDQTAPYIAHAWFLDDQVVLNFSEKINPEQAETPGNCIILGLNVKQARLQQDQRSVVLEVSERDPNANYNVVVTNIADLSPAANKIKVESVEIKNGLMIPATINLGSEAESTVYEPDHIYNVDMPYGREGGTIVTHPTTMDFANTQEDALYQTEVRDLHFYRVRLPDGQYKITFLFAESEFNNAGQRQFDVFVENQKVIENLDIFEKAGNITAYPVTIENVTVSDEKLDIYFKPIIGQPVCSGLRIEKSTTGLQGQNISVPQNSTLKIFPNPANPHIQMEFYLSQDGNSEIIFYDISGRKVLDFNRGNRKRGTYRYKLDVSHWGSGLYFCVVKQRQQIVARQKFVVLK